MELGSVYIVRLGSRIKIGWSSCPPARLADIPHEEVLAIIPGGLTLEARLHHRFAHLNVPLLNGMHEWFEDDATIRAAVPEIVEESRIEALNKAVPWGDPGLHYPSMPDDTEPLYVPDGDGDYGLAAATA